jgi:hypothetical protein
VKRRIFVHGPLAHCLTCTACSLSVWFEKVPEELRGPSAAPDGALGEPNRGD